MCVYIYIHTKTDKPMRGSTYTEIHTYTYTHTLFGWHVEFVITPYIEFVINYYRHCLRTRKYFRYVCIAIRGNMHIHVYIHTRTLHTFIYIYACRSFPGKICFYIKYLHVCWCVSYVCIVIRGNVHIPTYICTSIYTCTYIYVYACRSFSGNICYCVVFAHLFMCIVCMQHDPWQHHI